MAEVSFAAWFFTKYQEWRQDKAGQAASITEFAKLFSATHQIVGDWMKEGGKVPNSIKYINALVAVYGFEVYDVLGLPRPTLLEADVKLLIAASRELSRSMKALGIDEDDPRYDSLAIEVYSKFGLVLEKIEFRDGK